MLLSGEWTPPNADSGQTSGSYIRLLATHRLRIIGEVEREDLLRTVYDAFNARDIDAVLHHMTVDVDWPNAWEGGRVSGHDGVRDYWTRQWSAIDPTVTPVALVARSDGRVAVDVQQTARSLDGAILGEGRVLHIYTFRDGLISRMDVLEIASTD